MIVRGQRVADVHALDRNYRSCSDIVLAAKRLIRHNRLRFDKDYQPALTEPGELVIRGYSSPEVEARQVGRAIADLIRRGCAAQDIAILYRAGAVGVPLQTVLKEMAFPFEVRGRATYGRASQPSWWSTVCITCAMAKCNRR